MDIKDRITGAFVGMYFGAGALARKTSKGFPKGALPLPNKKEIEERFGRLAGYSPKLSDGRTHDIGNQIQVIYSLLMEKGEVTAKDFADKLLELHKKYNVFKGDVYGPSTQKAVRCILEKKDYTLCGNSGVTDGAAMRALPIALFFYKNKNALIKNTVESCKVTHNTDIAISGALGTNVMLANLIQGKSKSGALKQTLAVIKERYGKYGYGTCFARLDKRIEFAVSGISKLTTRNQKVDFIAYGVGRTWDTIDAIPAAFAIYFGAKNLEEAILLSYNSGVGGSNVSLEIACAFLGAEKGLKIFPKETTRKIEEVNKIKIYKMAEKLIKKIKL